MAKHTTVTMLYSDSGKAVFGVYRAHVRNPEKRWTWNVNHATAVGTITVKRGEARPSYRAMAERFATPEWPALSYPRS